MKIPLSNTSAGSPDAAGLDDLDDHNAFGFQASPPDALPPVAGPSTIQDAPAGRPRPAPPVRSPIEIANDLREKSGLALRQLVWHFPDGSARVPSITSSRWALYEALHGRMGADDFVPMLTPDESSAQAWRRRYLEAGVLLYLCLHAAEVWENPRTITHAGRTLELEPLIANFADFLVAIRRWMDHAVPPHRLSDAVAISEQLIALTFSAATVPGVDPNDEDSDTEGAEKKTPRQDGKIDTWPASAVP